MELKVYFSTSLEENEEIRNTSATETMRGFHQYESRNYHPQGVCAHLF
jgi:hypothetical protein